MLLPTKYNGAKYRTKELKGCYYRYKGNDGLINGYKVNAIDTTGAEDAFLGVALSVISDLSLDIIHEMDRDSFGEIISLANATGTLATTRKGAIPAMPDTAAIQELILERVIIPFPAS